MHVRTKSLLCLAVLGSATLALLLFHSGIFTRSSDRATGASFPGITQAEANRTNSSTENRAKPHTVVESFWVENWRALSAASPDAERVARMIALLEELAAIDPRQALALAEREGDPDRRTEFFQAVARGWGGAEPEAAIAWARSQTFLDSGLALAAVYHGAAGDAERAMQITQELSKQDPGRASDYGGCLVAALCMKGKFDQAASFASSASDEHRTNFMADTYARWAETEPHAALSSASRIADAETQRNASNTVISRWAFNEPQAVAEYALGLSGDLKEFALAVAIPQWAEKSPSDAAAWLGRFDPTPELDKSIAAIATNPQFMREPETALIWASGVFDQDLRARALATVLNEWTTIDPSAARRYAKAIGTISPEDEEELSKAFSPTFEPLSLQP